MPISREEFNGGQLNFTIHVVAVLESISELAFSFSDVREEVAARLGGLLPDERDLLLVLRTLEAGGVIECKHVGGQEYWQYNENRGMMSDILYSTISILRNSSKPFSPWMPT